MIPVAESKIPNKDVRSVRGEVNIEIPANSAATVGVINSILSFPSGYTLEGITLMSSSAGNCVPFLRYIDNTIFVMARNFFSGSITVTIYVRGIFVKS